MNKKNLYQLASICFFISGIILLITGQNYDASPLIGLFQIMLGITFMAINRNNKK